MKKRILSALLLVAAFCVGATILVRLLPARSKPQTSYLVIVVDSMRADHVGAYGYGRPTTPRIDALARAGVVFENAFTQAPWTKPSVASIFTSTYISVHRVLYSKQVVGGESHSDVLNEKFLTLAEAMKARGFATGGFGQKIHLRPQFGFSQGFDGYDMHAGRAERVNRAARAWLRREDPERFFLYLHYNDPHYPYRPRKEFAMFGGAEPRVQIMGETKRAFREGSLRLTAEDMHALVDLYDGEILCADHYIGELIADMAKMGYGNLVVVVTADHGEEFLEHGDITHGQSLYGELVRVPLIVGGSGLAPGARGRRHASSVQLIDIMPTLLEASDAPMPPGLQGRSFLPALAGAASEGAGVTVFSERRGPEERDFWGSIFDGRWKLIVDATHDRTMLFDLVTDPKEKHPLGDAAGERAAGLRARLEAWSSSNHALYERIRPEDTRPLDPETEERLRSLGYVD